jgi:hypothetical protein
VALPDWVPIGGIAVAVAGTLISLLKARPEARKLNSDGAAALTTGAGALVTAVQAEMHELRQEVGELRKWRRNIDLRMRAHARWDDEVVAVARASGLEIGDPPKLYEEQDG